MVFFSLHQPKAVRLSLLTMMMTNADGFMQSKAFELFSFFGQRPWYSGNI
jgi:hypothetical protein